MSTEYWLIIIFVVIIVQSICNSESEQKLHREIDKINRKEEENENS